MRMLLCVEGENAYRLHKDESMGNERRFELG